MTEKEKILSLIKAYYDGKEILVKDPIRGIKNWVSIKDPHYWNYLTELIKNINKYRILDDGEEIDS